MWLPYIQIGFIFLSLVAMLLWCRMENPNGSVLNAPYETQQSNGKPSSVVCNPNLTRVKIRCMKKWLYESIQPGDEFTGHCRDCGQPAKCKLISLDRTTGWAVVEVMEGHSDGMEYKLFLAGMVEHDEGDYESA